MLPDIPGTLVKDRSTLKNIKETVAKLLQSEASPNRFPGAQPISFTAKHLKELKAVNYFVSEKADGIRCLMFTTRTKEGRGITYLVSFIS